MMRFLRMLFCRHEWRQSYWSGFPESGYVCHKCGRIQFRKGDPGGPTPPGTGFSPTRGDERG